MNKIKYLFMAASLATVMVACDDDHKPDWDEPSAYEIAATSVSVTEGATVSVSTDVITVTYDHDIILNPAVAITLNGTPLEEVEIVDGNTIKAKVSLTKGKDYTFEIPARAVTAPNAMNFAPAVIVNFKAEPAPALDKSKIANAPVNANATAEAKRLYSFMLENYGEKQLSGAMGEVAWGTAFSDLISNAAGKYPAIVGFDYIHLASSPANWIDYGDITPVQNVWNAGSIPAVTWHWNVDMEAWAGETVMPDDWSGNIQLTFDAEANPDAEFTKALCAEVSDGTVITVKIKDVKAGAQGSVKDKEWAGLSSNTEYFDISGDEFSVRLNQEMADKVKENGFIISGHDYTATAIYVGKTCKESTGKGFVASNVLIPGTRENAVATADVAKVAGYLKLLQDAGIPVLFRPFHEAVGDFTWGHWFWWGNSGVDTTKELWKWLYNTLTNDYGLNNLIWVWTMQTSNEGQPASVAQLQSTYPGDEYVDIVGADLYEAALSDQTAKFSLVNEAIGGKKIVALSETGNLLDIEPQIVENCLWSYFMGWYEQDGNGPGFISWNKNNEWSTVLNHPSVLNRGDFSIK